MVKRESRYLSQVGVSLRSVENELRNIVRSDTEAGEKEGKKGVDMSGLSAILQSSFEH